MKDPVLTPSPVLIIGTGLLGTSIALSACAALASSDLEDVPSPVAGSLARDLGAGTLEPVENPTIVVVAIPPDVTVAGRRASSRAFPHAVVTDVASVKDTRFAMPQAPPRLRPLGRISPDGGQERSGAIAADADLFVGRPMGHHRHRAHVAGSCGSGSDACCRYGRGCLHARRR